MAIDEKCLNDVCKLKQGAHTCSFLMVGAGGFECAKGTSIEGVVYNRRSSGTMNAMGDNCSGPPNFTPSNIEPIFH
jgi:hypothetical protein